MKISDLSPQARPPKRNTFSLVNAYIYNHIDDSTEPAQVSSVFIVDREAHNKHLLNQFEIGFGEKFLNTNVIILTDTENYILFIDGVYYLIDENRNIVKQWGQKLAMPYVTALGDAMSNVFIAMTKTGDEQE